MKWQDRYAKVSKNIEDRRGKPTPRPLPAPTSPPGDYANDWDAEKWERNNRLKDTARVIRGGVEQPPQPTPVPGRSAPRPLGVQKLRGKETRRGK